MSFDLYAGNCLDTLQLLDDASVDSIVTDPPYGLSFMGKKWDYDVPSEAIWRECLRVLKPGGHLLAFAGTRTQHRMAVRIEDAGFEIRDMIAWVYGSGFPKSLDVSKAIDKLDASDERTARRYRFTEWMVASCPLTPRRMDEVCGTNTMGRHWTDVPPNGKQPDVPTREHFEKLRPHIAVDVPEWVEQMVDERTVESENFKRREVVGVREMRDTSEVRIAITASATDYDAAARREVELTTAHTAAARQWQGWGTALKPALEPITVARKPLIGTVAENVLEHGTGALNIDGCRVGDTVETWPASRSYQRQDPGAPSKGTQSAGAAPPGRWPANLIHDGSDEVLAAFPDSGGSGPARTLKRGQRQDGEGWGMADQPGALRDAGTGSAARFFYCAKASKSDRGAENNHPTVKPTDLMRYLCRLVTPPGGVVLDPFMGSGSTGKAAVLEGFRFIGCEMSPEYLAIADARIAAVLLGGLA